MICPRIRDNLSKDGLIPDTFHHSVDGGKVGTRKGPSSLDELASYQLVGEVMAHQG